MCTSTKNAVETFLLDLDPKVSLAERIRAGNYGYVNPDITPENFTLTVPAGKREVVLYDPKGYTSSEAMIARMKADGYVPATLDDALAMGQKYPDRQRANPIVFLGSVWPDPNGYQRVPVLVGWFGGRWLCLVGFGGGWLDFCRFAAVRES